MNTAKGSVRSFWEANPCAAGEVNAEEGSAEFFQEVERRRFEGDDLMPGLAGFRAWRNVSMLEIGCGLGTDLIQFARGGARVFGVDITRKAAALSNRRLAMEGFPRRVTVADAERLPFPDGVFPFVYSWGVLHHTPDTRTAISEAIRVCRPGGTILLMLYHRRSLFALQVWTVFALLRGRPFMSFRRVIADHVESEGTKAFTIKEARRLAAGLVNVEVRPVATRYDLRLGRRRWAPRWMRTLVPDRFGWFLVIRGTKPPVEQAGT